MNIDSFFLGPLETGSYLVSNDKLAVAVDVGGDPTPMLAAIQRQGLIVTHILLTHLHFDHILGVAALQAACARRGQDPQALLHEADVYLLKNELGQGGMMGMPKTPAFSYSPVALGRQTFAGLECTVLHTPGHTPGGVSYYFPAAGAAFVGDALFHRSVGRTDFPGGDADTLFNSIRTQLFTLPESTVVYPGHGPETTIGDEKCFNPFVSGRDI